LFNVTRCYVLLANCADLLTNVVLLIVCMVLNVTGTVAAEVDAEQTGVQTRSILTTCVTDRCFCLAQHKITAGIYNSIYT